MRRILPILLALLLLTGCAGEPAAASTEPAEETRTAAQSLYAADSAIETGTNGAVRAYPLEKGPYWRLLLPMQDALLVMNDGGQMLRIDAQTGEVLAAAAAELPDGWQNSDVAVTAQNVLLYDRLNRTVEVRDAQLSTVRTVTLPADSTGDPLLHAGSVFYCTGTQIRSLDLQTGVSRLLRENSREIEALTGPYFDGSVIGCRTGGTLLYLSAETGQALFEDPDGYTLQTAGEAYFAAGQEGFLFGTRMGDAACLLPLETHAAGLPAIGCAVGYQQTEDGLTLSCYDLATGKRTAEAMLPGVLAPKAVTTDGRYVWLLTENILCRWDLTAVQLYRDETYTVPRYTAENPDTAGLAACAERAAQLQAACGVQLYLWQEAMTVAGDLAQTAEYRVEETEAVLTAIENILKTFPADFLKTTGSIDFSLVGSLSGGEPVAQFRDGAQCHVVLDATNPAQSFLQGLWFGIDTRVLGNSRDFDTWEQLNPRGFEYTYDYAANLLREDYTDDLTHFIDLASMSFPTEDRSRIFAAAVLPGNGAYFENSGLQKKLQRMCEGIREAYGLEETPGILPWEQYLDTPLAPKD